MSEVFIEKCKELSDAQLAELINRGEYIYLGVLIERYTPLIRSGISKLSDAPLDADDLFQEATLALCSAIKAYDPEKSAFSTFAALCINRALAGELRTAVSSRRVPSGLISPIDDVELAGGTSPEAILIEKESYKRLTDSIRLELSELEYRVLCAFLADKSYADIARELGVTVKSVDNSLRRIRTKLKGM